MSASVFQRIGRALRFDASLFKFAAQTPSLNREAVMLLLLMGVITSVANLPGAEERGDPLIVVLASVNPLFPLALALPSSWVARSVGGRLFGGAASFGGVFRPLAYASAPQLLGVFSFIATLSGALSWVGAVWSACLAVVAVREAMGLGTGKAAVSVIVATLAAYLLMGSVFAAVTLSAHR